MTLREISSDDEERALALAREIGLRDYLTNINSARRQGKQEGVAEGEAKGRAEGKTEATRSFALKLLQKGFELPEVAELTGLSLEQITQIQKSL